jgi:hypothetical protein
MTAQLRKDRITTSETSRALNVQFELQLRWFQKVTPLFGLGPAIKSTETSWEFEPNTPDESKLVKP